MIMVRRIALTLAMILSANVSVAGELSTQSALMQKHEVILPSGRLMNMVCVGQGSPTLIFENGLGGNLLHWQKVVSAASALTRSCFYDRAGYGFSAPAEGPRTASAAAHDLHDLIKAASIRSPVVLIGHSLGGLIATLYTDIYPNEVAGLVLIDPSFAGEGDPARTAAGKVDDQASYDDAQSQNLRCASLAWKHQLTTADPHGCFSAAPNRSAAEVAFLMKQYLRPFRYETVFSESENLNAAVPGADVDSLEESERARLFGDKPIIVLTAERGESSDAEEQRRW